jgi:hypothetical protein
MHAAVAAGGGPDAVDTHVALTVEPAVSGAPTVAAGDGTQLPCSGPDGHGVDVQRGIRAAHGAPTRRHRARCGRWPGLNPRWSGGTHTPQRMHCPEKVQLQWRACMLSTVAALPPAGSLTDILLDRSAHGVVDRQRVLAVVRSTLPRRTPGTHPARLKSQTQAVVTPGVNELARTVEEGRADGVPHPTDTALDAQPAARPVHAPPEVMPAVVPRADRAAGDSHSRQRQLTGLRIRHGIASLTQPLEAGELIA